MKIEMNQEQRQIISPAMIQTFELVMLPGMDLKEKLEEEAKINPVIQLEKRKTDYSKARSKNRSSSFDSQSFLENMSVYDFSLYKSMMEQVADLGLHEKQLRIAEIILSSVHENGFLQKPDEKGVMQAVNPEVLLENTDFTVKEFEEVRKKILLLDPIGIGSYHIKEYLEIQALDRFGEKSLEYKILHSFVDLLEKKLHTKIAKELGVSQEAVKKAIMNITTLNIVPAAHFETGYSQYIVPDAFVNVTEEGIQLTLNDEYIPDVKLNRHCIDLFSKEEFRGRKTNLDKNEKHFLKESIEKARILIENLKTRKEIIFKVILKIIEKQRNYFILGPEHQVPLKLKDIADDLNIHESTVSRVVRDKYIQTNKGMIHLKSFFSTNVGNQDRSSSSIKETLKNFIDIEDKDDPFSDDRLVQLFSKKNIQVSRRTVAKYRSELNIPPAFMRRNPI